jgi:drug/metabolite transporter (DMT)-like permease
METALVLAAVSGVCWALNIIAVRWALPRTEAPALIGAVVGISVAAVVALLIAIASGSTGPSSGDFWRFALVGAIAPGSSQGLFVASIGSIGPARSSVLVGTAPMFSMLGAIAFLDESWSVIIVVGTLLTVIGGALIGWEPGQSWRRFGVVYALAAALTFAARDVVASSFGGNSDVSAWWSGALVLSAAAIVLMGIVAVSPERRRIRAGVTAALPEFIASGVAIGLALPLLLAALERGRVGAVAPLSNAVQNLTVVVLAGIFFGVQERTPRVLAALAMVVVGGALITAA